MEVSLMDELDDLHEPTSCIKEAQMLAAELYGADATYFMINGTTGAIQAMLLAALHPGDTVIVPRNAHRSIIGGIMLGGAIPVFIQPEIDERLGIAMGVAPDAVENAIIAHPEARAVVLVYPTYYGVATDIGKIAGMVHARKMLLLVDEAHGPHLRFSKDLPVQALDAGADIVAQSTHKILGSLTQTSMLHACAKRVDMERLKTMVSLVQSTSPNYLLLASLDVARLQMAEQGPELIGRAVLLAEQLRRDINTIDGLWCFGKEYMHTAGSVALDLTKLTVQVCSLGISGAEAEHILRHEYKIQCELSDMYNVLFIISLGDSEKETALLLESLKGLAAKCRGHRQFKVTVELPVIPPQRLLPREALFAASEMTCFMKAAGCIAAEVITFYPPGIPIICPGEEITQEIIDYAKTMQRIGLKVVGPVDASLQTIKVIKAAK